MPPDLPKIKITIGSYSRIMQTILHAGHFMYHVRMLENMYTLPYSRKIWRGIKFWRFGSLACDRQIKIRQYFIFVYIRMAIPYRTAKFRSANVIILGACARVTVVVLSVSRGQFFSI